MFILKPLVLRKFSHFSQMQNYALMHREGLIVQLPSIEPRNCEKCYVFWLIHVPNGLMNKLSFVAQTVTLGNLFN